MMRWKGKTVTTWEVGQRGNSQVSCTCTVVYETVEGVSLIFKDLKGGGRGVRENEVRKS